ncbi:MAG TPA: hypothetical protein PKA95_18645, partial [Thermomicrobiales bacterium]|nr:hypothetical protein [Thermomicrobiales bacterium]
MLTGYARRKLAHLLAVAVITIAALAGGLAPGSASAEDSPVRVPIDASGMPAKTYFPLTSHSLSGSLLKAWNTTGLM